MSWSLEILSGLFAGQGGQGLENITLLRVESSVRIPSAILVVAINSLPMIPPAHDMINGARILYSQFAGHNSGHAGSYITRQFLNSRTDLFRENRTL